MVGWAKRDPRGHRTWKFKTWLQVWMEANKISAKEMAKILMCSEYSVTKWRRGDSISRHYARLIRAYFPDCPVHAMGGPAPRLADKLPINARTKRIYRFIMRQSELVHGLANEQAITYARESTGWGDPTEPGYDPIRPEYAAEAERTDPRNQSMSEPSDGPMASGEPDGGGVGDVL